MLQAYCPQSSGVDSSNPCPFSVYSTVFLTPDRRRHIVGCKPENRRQQKYFIVFIFVWCDILEKFIYNYLLTFDIFHKVNVIWSRSNSFTENNLTQILDRWISFIYRTKVKVMVLKRDYRFICIQSIDIQGNFRLFENKILIFFHLSSDDKLGNANNKCLLLIQNRLFIQRLIKQLDDIWN